MEPRTSNGSINGYPMPPPPPDCGRPEYVYESAARSWTQAKERKDAARERLAEAEKEMQQAHAAEAETWERLLDAADRNPNTKACATSSPRPR